MPSDLPTAVAVTCLAVPLYLIAERIRAGLEKIARAIKEKK